METAEAKGVETGEAHQEMFVPRHIAEDSPAYITAVENKSYLRDLSAMAFGEEVVDYIDSISSNFEQDCKSLKDGNLITLRSHDEQITKWKEQRDAQIAEVVAKTWQELKRKADDPQSFRSFLAFANEASQLPEMRAIITPRTESPFAVSSEIDTAIRLLDGEIGAGVVSALKMEITQEIYQIFGDMLLDLDVNDLNAVEKLVHFISAEQVRRLGALDAALPILREYYKSERGIPVSTELARKAIEYHVIEFKQRSAEFRERVPSLIESFKDKVKIAITEGILPIDTERLEQRLAMARIELFDPVAKDASVVFDQYGEMQLETRMIQISAHCPDDQIEHSFTHEGIHLLAGMSLVEPRPGEVYHQRNGLSFFRTVNKRVEESEDGKAAMQQERLFTWFDESVTEVAALILDGISDVGFYKTEQGLLKKMIEKGIHLPTVLKAYFENYDPDIPMKERAAAWKALRDNLNEVYGKEGIKLLLRVQQAASSAEKSCLVS